MSSLFQVILQGPALTALSKWLQIPRAGLFLHKALSRHKSDLRRVLHAVVEDDDWEKQCAAVQCIASVGLCDVSSSLMFDVGADAILDVLRCGPSRPVRVCTHRALLQLREGVGTAPAIVRPMWAPFMSLLLSLDFEALIDKDSRENVYGEDDCFPDPRSLHSTFECY